MKEVKIESILYVFDSLDEIPDDAKSLIHEKNILASIPSSTH